MCGRYGTEKLTWDEIVLMSRLPVPSVPTEALAPRWNIAPTQAAPILRRDGDAITATLARWDLVPFWWKKPLEEKRYSTFNARLEEIGSKATYREPIRHRRCLVPATYFVEWRKEGKARLPYRIGRADGRPFMMSGVWDRWRGTHKGAAVDLVSFSIVVTAANPLVGLLHDRMPVILHPEDHATWLDGDVEAALAVAGAYPSQLMTALPLDGRINASRNEGDPALAEPAGPPLAC